jgi:DNA polymerase-3 subunit epsilon
MRREIVLDTETTGIDPRQGHRVIEIACIELLDRLPSGRTFHRYVNPDRRIDADAERVHGISDAHLADKPRFHHPEVCEPFLAFVAGAPIIAHNAAFDRGFVNHELQRAGRKPIGEEWWVCSLKLAQARHPGMYNSLDALCKRYKISLSERDKHGALIDARLLAAVYFQLQTAEEQALDLTAGPVGGGIGGRPAYGERPRPLAARSTPEERDAHAAFIREVLKDKALWLTMDAA